jgi:2-C-methyl-D-erythritol 2,4-cyclodiphosphate synthase
MRTGIGFDAHRFDDSRPLILGGVHIPDSPGLAGHSDADVLSHAIGDALLGAASAGDLGEMFPADDANRGVSSLEILDHVVAVIGRNGWQVENVDATVIAERPALSGYREQMIESLAEAMAVPPERVWVKATTTDGLGFTGRGEGIAALAVSVVSRESSVG